MHSRYIRSRFQGLNRNIYSCERYLTKVMKGYSDNIKQITENEDSNTYPVVSALTSPATNVTCTKSLQNDEDKVVYQGKVYQGRNATIEVTVKTNERDVRRRRCKSLNAVKSSHRVCSEKRKQPLSAKPASSKLNSHKSIGNTVDDRMHGCMHIPWYQLFNEESSVPHGKGVSESCGNQLSETNGSSAAPDTNSGEKEKQRSACEKRSRGKGDNQSQKEQNEYQKIEKITKGRSNCYQKEILHTPRKDSVTVLCALVDELWGKKTQIRKY